MELMIDLETLGTKTDAPVISIGAIFFDIEKDLLGPTFYVPIDLADQINSGKRRPDVSTIKWWMTQEGAAKKVFKEQTISVEETLKALSKFALQHGKKSLKVWGNGSTFDISILESLYDDYGIEIPWLFYNVMDLRTFKRFVANNRKVEKTGTNHNALDDAKSQAQYILDTYKKTEAPVKVEHSCCGKCSAIEEKDA